MAAAVAKQWQVDWKYMRTPLHSAAHVLNPANQDEKHHQNPALWTDFVTVAIRLLGDWDGAQAIEQFHSYRSRMGLFALAAARTYRPSSNPWDYWASYGCGVPELQKLAFKVRSQPSSAIRSEQN